MSAHDPVTLLRAVAGAVLALTVAVPGAAQKTHGPTLTISGRVVDSLSHPLAGANILIGPLHATATTDPAGRFRLVGVPATGAWLLQVRKLGYGPVDVAVLMPRDTSIASIVLDPGAVLLRTVVTKTVGLFDKPARLANTAKYDEFYERRKYSTGSGIFYTHEDIERMDVQDFMDILRRVPRLKIWDSGGNTRIRFPHCGMDGIMIELDGNRIWPVGTPPQRDIGLSNPTPASIMAATDAIPMDGPDPLDLLRPLRESDVEAMEVYPSSSSLPADAVGTSCAAIYVWTR